MPTLIRLICVIGLLVALGYGVLTAMVAFLVPQQREIVQTVPLPQGADVSTGRSAVERLTSEAGIGGKDKRARP